MVTEGDSRGSGHVALIAAPPVLRRTPLVAFALCLACSDTTSSTAAVIVAGTTYDLVRLDGRGAPFEYVAPGRWGEIRVAMARIELLFNAAEPTYDFRQYRGQADTGSSIFRSSYRQRGDGIVQLMGYGTFDDGVNREYVEGTGSPESDILRLRTTSAFIYGRHDWEFRRRER